MSKIEGLGRVTQKVIETVGTELPDMIGNATEKSFYAVKFDQIRRGAVTIESFRAVGSTSYKVVEDIARNDQICAGACAIATACEIIAGTYAVIKYPGVMQVYFVAKGISVGCIRFRNFCRNAKGEITPC